MEILDLNFEGRKHVCRYKCPQCGTCDRFEILFELNIYLRYGKIERRENSTKKELSEIGYDYSKPHKYRAYFDDLIDCHLLLIRCEECEKLIEDEVIYDQIYNDVAKMVSFTETEVLV